MFRICPAFFLLPLILGGLVVAKEKAEAVEKKASKPTFALKLVHRETDELMKAIEADEKLIPEGYTIVPLEIMDRDSGEVVGGESLLVRVENIISEDDFQGLGRVPNPGEVIVRLTAEGGQKLGKATRKLKLGQDRIAVIFEDRALVAPTVQAVLTDSFVVSGLGSSDRVDHFIETLSPDDSQ